MQPVGGHDDERLRPAAAVAAVPQCAVQAVVRAVLTDPSVPQQDAVRAEQAEVVERQHHRHAALFGGAHDGRAEEQQRIVDVDGVDVLLFYDIPHVAGGPAVPDGAKGQQRLSRAVGGLLIAALIDDDGVAVLLQQGALRGKDGVLAAGQPVMTVYQQNFHAAASSCRQ